MLLVASCETDRDGRIIFEEGGHGDGVYLIESGGDGTLQDHPRPRGDDRRPAGGEVFGRLAFVAQVERTVSARAGGRDMHLGVLDRAVLDEECNRLSGRFRDPLRSLVRRLKQTTGAMIQARLRELSCAGGRNAGETGG